MSHDQFFSGYESQAIFCLKIKATHKTYVGSLFDIQVFILAFLQKFSSAYNISLHNLSIYLSIYVCKYVCVCVSC